MLEARGRQSMSRIAHLVPTQDIKVLWASAWPEVSRLRRRKGPRSQGTPQDRKFETEDLQSLAARSKSSRFLYSGGVILKVWCGETIQVAHPYRSTMVLAAGIPTAIWARGLAASTAHDGSGGYLPTWLISLEGKGKESPYICTFPRSRCRRKSR